MKETSIEELCNEYAGAYREVDMCDRDFCKVCPADKERMQEIIKEITTKIEEYLLREVIGSLPGLITKSFRELNPKKEDSFNAWDCAVKEAERNIKSLAESKNINI